MRIRTAPAVALFAALIAACAGGTTQRRNTTPAPRDSDVRPARADFTPAADRARQAVNRLTFGARSGDLGAVEHMGVDKWIERQLHPERIPDPEMDAVLGRLETQGKKAFELLADHPTPEELAPRLRPRAAGDSTMRPLASDSALYRASVTSARALTAEVVTSKVLRAAYSERQLLELMVDFWENHFSVSINKSPNRYSMLEYDRDVIRPRALGKFRDLLGAVAESPQMLYYLDQWQSTVDSLHPNYAESRIQARRASMAVPPMGDSTLLLPVNHRRTGINENYGRELMELHTLGVNGGYTQQDVIEVARCLTGWTIDGPQFGGAFHFRQESHDAGVKTVLGHHMPAGRGIDDGEEVLDLLARHPSTARFIAKKLVTRFVSDTPPPALVDRAADTFLRTDGDIREVMRTIVTSPEFFSQNAFRAKVKTPFELVVSTLRALGIPPDTTARAVGMIAQLGQPIWQHLTPEGWPDRGEAWMNSGALLNRVNFEMAVANSRFPGANLAAWPPLRLIANAPAEEAVQRVVDELLESRASPATRDALMAALSAHAGDKTPAPVRLAELIGTALGSPEFQRR